MSQAALGLVLLTAHCEDGADLRAYACPATLLAADALHTSNHQAPQKAVPCPNAMNAAVAATLLALAAAHLSDYS